MQTIQSPGEKNGIWMPKERVKKTKTVKDKEFDFYWEEQFNEYEYVETSDSPMSTDPAIPKDEPSLLD